MTELRRSWSGSLVVRASTDPDERIVEGRVLPYGQAATVRDVPGGPQYREIFRAGAAAGVDPSRVKLESGASFEIGRLHEGARLIGRGISADDRPDGLHMAFRIARTAAGDEAYELAREGVLTDFSVVGTVPANGSRRLQDGTWERTAVALKRVALLENGAYEGAQVTAVRAATEGDMPAPNQAAAAAAEGETTEDQEQSQQPPATPAPAGDRPNRTRVTVDVERAAAEEQARVNAERGTAVELARAGVGSGMRGAFVTRPEAVYGPSSEHSFLRDGFLMARGNAEAGERQTRHAQHVADVALAIERATSWGEDGRLISRAGDMLSSEIPGAYPNDYLPGLLTPRILKGRPMGGFYQRFPVADARPRIFPKVTTSTSVAVQSAEGAALSAVDIASTAVTATPLIYGAYVDVSRQAIDGADPAAQTMLLQDLIESYSQASETVIKTAVEAGATDSGVAITAATPYAGAIANVVNYYGVRFTPATAAFIPPAAFSTLLAQADTAGRPLIPQLGPVNSDGQVQVGSSISAPLLSANGTLSWASTANVWVFGVPTDYVIFESSIAQFSYDQIVGPQAVRIGIWAYLVVGTRLGSLKKTAA